MFRRYTSHRSLVDICRIFGVVGAHAYAAPNGNVAPKQQAAVIRTDRESCRRLLDLQRWGLLPRDTKIPKVGFRPINTASESIIAGGIFRGALAARRCLVPADAFYEWQTTPDGKQPYAIARADGEPLALAALWDEWASRDGDLLRTFTVLTTTANGIMQAISDRMPVIVEPGDWGAWLDQGEGRWAALMRPARDGVLRIWPVGGVDDAKEKVMLGVIKITARLAAHDRPAKNQQTGTAAPLAKTSAAVVFSQDDAVLQRLRDRGRVLIAELQTAREAAAVICSVSRTRVAGLRVELGRSQAINAAMALSAAYCRPAPPPPPT